MRISALLAASITTFGFASVAVAATETDNLEVTATVAQSCSIEGDTLAFGTYTMLDTTDTDATATITVVCNSGAAAKITLGAGSNEDGSTPAAPLRRMKDAGTNLLSYQLYTESGRTDIWGDTVGSSVDYDANSQAMTVFGRIAAAQDVPAGDYTDTVVATITF